MSSNKPTFFRWPIVDFCKQYLEAKDDNETLVSPVFTSTTDLDVQFALFYNPNGICWFDHKYGIVLKSLGNKESVKVDLKIWLENEEGKTFSKYSAHEKALNKVGEKFEFELKNTGNDWDLFEDVENNHKTLFICCELLDLNQSFVPVVDCKEDFLNDFWSLYKEGYHDAIIKADDTEFKVMKSFFIAHSPVLKRSFESNSKEDIISAIEIKGVEMHTMEHLIKWFYTSRIENDAPIEMLFIVAVKWDIKVLKSTCVQLMIKSFGSVNAFSRLILAVKYTDLTLKGSALNFIAELKSIDFVKFFKSSEWKELYIKRFKVAQEIENLLEEKLEK